MDLKLFNKFIANNCTSAEIEKVLFWLQKQPEQSLFKNYWDEIDLSEDMDANHVRQRLDSIHHIINLRQSEYLGNGKVRFLPASKKSLGWVLSRVAVFLLLPLVTLTIYIRFFQSGFVLENAQQKIETVSPPGSRTYLELADKTKVWLNHGSKLVYPQLFAGKERVVQIAGEAYFEVAPDKEKPFIVESDGIAVKAVGTAFNVRAYADGSDFETTLESGKVIIMKKSPDRMISIIDMEPGQHFVYNISANQYSIKTEELTKYVSWKEGKLIFKDDRMDKVAEQLSRWFDVKITLNDSLLRELTYTATFIDEPLSQVLEMMEVVTPISYTVSERGKKPDGTYSKKEILIYKRKGGQTN